MPFCPSCRSEFRPGFYHCERCQVALVDYPTEPDPFADPRAMAAMLAGRKLAAAFSGSAAALSEMRDALSRRRIPSMVAPSGEKSCSGPGLLLVVGEEDLPQVEQFFESGFESGLQTETLQYIGPCSTAETGEEPSAASCPACGCTRRPDAEGCCPECGLFLTG